MSIAAVYATKVLVEPSKILKPEPDSTEFDEFIEEDNADDEDEDEDDAPENLDILTLCTIVAGSMADNVGSTGLMRMFSMDFVYQGWMSSILSHASFSFFSTISFPACVHCVLH